MSNEDRGGLIETFTKDLLLQYHHSGEFTGFNDNKTKLLEGYLGHTQHLYNKTKMTTDSATLKLSETHHPFLSSGLSTEQKSAEDLTLFKILKNNRKGEFIAITPDDYIQKNSDVVKGSCSSARIAKLTEMKGWQKGMQGGDTAPVSKKKLDVCRTVTAPKISMVEDLLNKSKPYAP